MPHPTFIDVELDRPHNVLAINDNPLMSLGRDGTFDDSGITPVSIVRHEGTDRMYYVGWKRRRFRVSFEASIGLAVLHSDGNSMSRVYDGPILAQDKNHPLMTAAPFVLVEHNRFRMWYCSGTEWRPTELGPEPIYTVFYAESADGIDWIPSKKPVIQYRYDGEVISAPWVIRCRDRYRMWYSTRGYATKEAKNYAVGYAESVDGLSWERLDELAGISRSDEGWDSEMICYPSFFQHGNKVYMFYSGNGVGRGGIGYAVADNFLD